MASRWLKTFSRPIVKRSRHPIVPARGNSSKVIVENKKYGAIVTKATLEDPAKPVAVILGWNESKIKHLQRYSGLFESQGWSTVCLPAKYYNTFLRSGTKVKTISLYVIDVIKDLVEKGNLVLLYSFSNGGCSVYFHIAEALTTPGQQHFDAFKVAGSIFDSCPAYPTVESIPRLKTSVTEGMRNPIAKALISHALGLAIPFVLKQPLLKRFPQDFGKMPLKSPELFLYSTADDLVPHEEIEKHINIRRSHGVEVFSKCWDDSLHVSHYLKHPEQYTEMVENFLKVCFKGDSEK